MSPRVTGLSHGLGQQWSPMIHMPPQPAFDAYHRWLGIPPKDQPPHHYRLLGLELFESDVDVIEAAANRQMVYVLHWATGEHAAMAQRLLNELSAARRLPARFGEKGGL